MTRHGSSPAAHAHGRAAPRPRRQLAGNAGSPCGPCGFRFDEAAKGGGAKSNPLDIRLAAFSLRPKPTPTPGN